MTGKTKTPSEMGPVNLNPEDAGFAQNSVVKEQLLGKCLPVLSQCRSGQGYIKTLLIWMKVLFLPIYLLFGSR